MTSELSGLIERARAAAGGSGRDAAAPSSNERVRLQRVAQEFESMLLVQMLRDMRRSGAWEDESEEGGLGAEAFSDTIDSELASQLSKGKGLGLATQLLDALDRMAPRADTPASAGPRPQPAVVAAQSEVASESTGAAVPVEPLPMTDAAGARVAPTTAPVTGQVTSGFGWRPDPFTGVATFHNGVDLRAVYGQDVQAAGAGRIVFSGEQGGYGTTVMIEHADGTRTRYAHLSATLVPVGAVVTAGQPIGRAGHSGRATGTHVHFEVIDARGRPIAPEQWTAG